MSKKYILGSVEKRGNSDIISTERYEAGVIAGGTFVKDTVNGIVAYDGAGIISGVASLSAIGTATTGEQDVVFNGLRLCVLAIAGVTAVKGAQVFVDATGKVANTGTEINAVFEANGKVIGVDGFGNDVADAVLIRLGV